MAGRRHGRRRPPRAAGGRAGAARAALSPRGGDGQRRRRAAERRRDRRGAERSRGDPRARGRSSRSRTLRRRASPPCCRSRLRRARSAWPALEFVDATLRGTTVAFIRTHLEVAGSPAAAAVQLAAGRRAAGQPADTSLTVVMLGDFNAARAPTYAAPAGGLRRRVDPRPPRRPRGFTCRHTELLDAPGDTPRPHRPHLHARRDRREEALLVGAEPGDAADRPVAVRPRGGRGDARTGLISTLVDDADCARLPLVEPPEE